MFFSESNWGAIRNGNLSNLPECSGTGKSLLFYNAVPMQVREGASNRIVSRLVTTTPLQLVVQPQTTTQTTPTTPAETTPTTPAETTPTTTTVTTPTIPPTEDDVQMQLRNTEEDIRRNVRKG